jgi:carbon monoxide dehydrogenase subunit G
MLTDLESVALCLPGARLTGVEGEVYSGEVRVKVGPVVAEYAGTAHFLEKDDASHRAVIDAKGRESRGAGNASALITVQLGGDGDHTVVTVHTDMKISGKIAQMGGGMIKEVSEKLLGQFAECLEAKLSGPIPSESPAPASSSVPAAETGVADQHGPAASARPREVPAQEPLDLMALAGGAMAKRLIPVAVVVVAAVALVVYLLVR